MASRSRWTRVDLLPLFLSPRLSSSALNAGLLPYRNDNNTWLGETKDRRIGFFKSEHVEEVMDENFDGGYKNVSTLSLLPRCLKLYHLM